MSSAVKRLSGHSIFCYVTPRGLLAVVSDIVLFFTVMLSNVFLPRESGDAMYRCIRCRIDYVSSKKVVLTMYRLTGRSAPCRPMRSGLRPPCPWVLGARDFLP